MLIKDGADGKTIGKLDFKVPADDTYGVGLTGAFCGITGRFVLSSGHEVTVYALPSGKRLVTLPASSWQDPLGGLSTVACSPTGTRVAILSGSRLTVHALK
jgi:hypothetical protein